MGFAIAILLTLAMLGSVLWVMPSPREKRIEQFRRLAMSKGVRVRLLDSALAGKWVPWVEDFRGLVSYHMPCKAGEKLPVSGITVIRLQEDEDMHELDRESALRRAFLATGLSENLPVCCEAVIFSPGDVAIVWPEQKTEEDLDKVLKALEACLEIDMAMLQAVN